MNSRTVHQKLHPNPSDILQMDMIFCIYNFIADVGNIRKALRLHQALYAK